jgi:hypothetical protein
MRRTMSRNALALMTLMFLGTLSQSVSAQSECAATNQNDDQICSVSCPLGQTASCNGGIGSSAPKCVCSGASTSLDFTAGEYRETKTSSSQSNGR